VIFYRIRADALQIAPILHERADRRGHHFR
jgi:hypothetical protein